MTRQAPDLVAVPLGLRVGFMLLQARDPVLPKDAAHQLWAEGPRFRILRSFWALAAPAVARALVWRAPDSCMRVLGG